MAFQKRGLELKDVKSAFSSLQYKGFLLVPQLLAVKKSVVAIYASYGHIDIHQDQAKTS